MALVGELRVDGMASLLSLVSPPSGIQNVDMLGTVTQTTEDEPPDVHPVSVGELVMWRDANLSVIQEMTHRINIHTLEFVVSAIHIYS